jgi:4-azaleucine resistance transporter AzlC
MSASTTLASFTLAGIRRGAVAAMPLLGGVLLHGVVFGVLARAAGLSTPDSVLMSVSIYSASAQMAVLQGWQAGSTVLAMVLAVLTVNARYVLYGAALQPWLQGLRPIQVYPSLYLLGDGNWALSLAHHDRGENDAGFVFGSGLAMFVAWLAGTAWGWLGADLIPAPKALGLDVMLAAFCVAVAAASWRNRRDLAPAAVAIFAAAITHHTLGAGWAIVVAGLAGAMAAAWRSGATDDPSSSAA